MNLYRIKRLKVNILGMWLLFIPKVSAGINATDSAYTKLDDLNLKKAMIRFVPDTYTLQHGGSIGLVSVGLGWDYGRSSQWSTEGLMGYVPAYDTDRKKITLTLRQTYTPWKKSFGDNFNYEILRTGLYINTTLGRQFWFSSPEKYPTNYYTFSTKVRVNVFIGQSIGYKFKSQSSFFEGMQFYYDLHTTDFNLISRVQNNYLSDKNYFGIALGMKMKIRRQ